MESWSFPLELGLVVRGRVKRELKRAAWQEGLDIQIEEARGLLSSSMNITVRGSADAVARYEANVLEWLRQVSTA
jgi:hypothetical protein